MKNRTPEVPTVAAHAPPLRRRGTVRGQHRGGSGTDHDEPREQGLCRSSTPMFTAYFPRRDRNERSWPNPTDRPPNHLVESLNVAGKITDRRVPRNLHPPILCVPMRAHVVMIVSLLIGGTATEARALDQLVAGRKLVLKTPPGKPGRMSWTSKEPVIVAPTPGAAEDPTISGAELMIVSGGGETATFDLPATNWLRRGRGATYPFKNRYAPAAPDYPAVVRIGEEQRPEDIFGQFRLNLVPV